jgi:hypothetical protein
MVVVFTKLIILITFSPMFFNKKRRRGPLELLVRLWYVLYIRCLYDGLYYPLRV